MARVYAREEDSDRRFIVRIECDKIGCSSVIKPGPQIASSGWTKRGSTFSPSAVSDYCPEHL